MRKLRTLVLCDDAWHPAEVVRPGLNALAHSRFDFEFLTSGAKWSPTLMKQFPVVVMAKANHVCATDQTPWLTADQGMAFPEFIQGGGGLLVVHGGTAGYKTLLPMRQSLGGGFLRHPEECQVTVEPKSDHPVAAGVNQFTVTDEHYFMELDAEDAEVFLETRSEHGVQPAGWTRTDGAGRVCVLTPGHNVDVWLHPEFQKLLRNGLDWVGKLT